MFNETNVCPSYQTLIINVLTVITRAVAKVNENRHEKGEENIKLDEEERTDTVCDCKRCVSTALHTPGSRVAR